MPIEEPTNDGDCLSKMHAKAHEFMQTERCAELARQFDTIDDLIEYIRALKQRNDYGDPLDGPRIQCDVSQRLRLPAIDPQCFERTALFLSVSQRIDPELAVSSATIRVNDGLHTFSIIIRDGHMQVVILDPRTHNLRNAMTAAAYRIRNASPMTAMNIGRWFTETAHHGCIAQGMGDTYQRAMADLRNGITTGQELTQVAAIEDMLAVTAKEAELFGPAGRVAYRRVHDSLHNLSHQLTRNGVRKYLDGLLDTDQPSPGDLIKAALIAQYGPAARIALYGVDLGVRKLDQRRADKARKKAEEEAARRQLEREQRRRRRHRMTLGFRNP